MNMFGLSLWQPHASLAALAAIAPDKGKHIETRHWSPLVPRRVVPQLPVTLAIHAADRFPRDMKEHCLLEPHFIRAMYALGFTFDTLTHRGLMRLPRKAFVAIADLVEVRETPAAGLLHTPSALPRPAPARGSAEAAFGNYEPGRFMWFLENIRALREPLPANGRQGFWPLPVAPADQIRSLVQ